MSGNVVIVLHAPADVALAEEIARELSPFAAFALCVSGAKPTRIGAGAIGVVVWTASLAALDLGVLAEDAVICLADRTTPPSEGRLIRTGPGGAYGVALRAEVSTVQAAREQARRGTGGVDGVGLAPAAAAYAARGAGSRMVVRSTTGLAAALAVVGVATPFVSGARVNESVDAQSVGLSLVGDARAAAGSVTQVSMQTQAARPAIETAASLPSPELASLEVDRDEGGFSMLEALVSTRSGAIQPHGTRQPDTSGDPRYVEILSNGEVVAGTVTAAPAAMIADQAPAAVGAGFSADLESLVHEAKFNSYHRMLGPPD